jgi:RadC-like JAB domain
MQTVKERRSTSKPDRKLISDQAEAKKKTKKGYSFELPWEEPSVTSEPDGRVCRYRAKTFTVELVREAAPYPAGQPLRSAEDVAIVARAIYKTLDADKEHFIVLAMNNKNRLQGYKVVSTGSLTSSLVHPREVWRVALHFCAAGVIFLHNRIPLCAHSFCRRGKSKFWTIVLPYCGSATIGCRCAMSGT